MLEQNRQHNHADEQGEQNHPRRQEHQFVTRREDIARRQQQRNGEHTGEGYRPAYARKRGNQQLTRCPRAELHRFFLQEADAEVFHRPQPAETHQHQRQVDQHDVGKEHPDFNVRIGLRRHQRGFHNARQLQAQQQEHHAVKDKLQHRPGAVGTQAHRQRRAAHHAGAGDGHPCRDRGQNARHADMFGNQIRGERQQEQQHDLRRGFIAAPAAEEAQ